MPPTFLLAAFLLRLGFATDWCSGLSFSLSAGHSPAFLVSVCSAGASSAHLAMMAADAVNRRPTVGRCHATAWLVVCAPRLAGSVERETGYVIMTNGENSGYTGVSVPLINGDALLAFLGGRLRSASE